MKLYELIKELAVVEHELEEVDLAEQEAPDALLVRLQNLEIEAKQKVFGVATWIKNVDSLSEALAAEIKRLQARKKSCDTLQSNLRKFILWGLNALGIDKLKNELHTISRRKASEQIVVDATKVLEWPAAVFDAAIKSGALREEYSVHKPLLKELPNWRELPGVSVIEGEESIQIR